MGKNRDSTSMSKISVLMSTYNESAQELSQSIKSILGQTYENIQIIIVNDNPDNALLSRLLHAYSKNQKVLILQNDTNMGLVKSLNKALRYADGDYIARMDADDISFSCRLADQITYLQKNDFDLIGSWVELIDPDNNTIQSVMKFPVSHSRIKKFIKYGNCIPHPTWLGKKEIFDDLGGYRDVKSCEDYDFILRAIKGGYKVGNIPKVELKYRIRDGSISSSTKIDQLILRRFLSDEREHIDNVSENDIHKYLSSDEFKKKKESIIRYNSEKITLRKGIDIKNLCKLFFEEAFKEDVIEKIALKLREL